VDEIFGRYSSRRKMKKAYGISLGKPEGNRTPGHLATDGQAVLIGASKRNTVMLGCGLDWPRIWCCDRYTSIRCGLSVSI
jgi:hypothetical protein